MRRPTEAARTLLVGRVVIEEGTVARRVPRGGKFSPELYPDAFGVNAAIPARLDIAGAIEVAPRFHMGVDGLGERQKKLLAKKMNAHFGSISKKTIAIWGLTFKPDTDDIRSSVAIDLVTDMLSEGAHVTVYDPKGANKARESKSIAQAKFAQSALEAVEGVEALVIATEWAEFANVDLAVVKDKMTTPIIFDGRNLFDPETMAKLGFHYFSIGRGATAPR